jgi:elongation factor P
MIDVNELRKGATFILDGEIYQVLDYHHHKPGRGNAIIRTKLRNLRTGATIDKTFISGDRVQDIRLDHSTVQYLYNEGDLYYFMDMETFEQPALSKDVLGDAVKYLTEGLTLQLESYEGEPLTVELPTTVDLEVVETAPDVRGDTAQGGGKPATLSTGVVVTVPFFINIGDVVRVDTRTGEHVTRVKANK